MTNPINSFDSTATYLETEGPSSRTLATRTSALVAEFPLYRIDEDTSYDEELQPLTIIVPSNALEALDPPEPKFEHFLKLPKDAQIRVFSYLSLKNMYDCIGNQLTKLLCIGDRLPQAPESLGIISSACKVLGEEQLSNGVELNAGMLKECEKIGVVLASEAVRYINIYSFEQNPELIAELFRQYPQIQSLALTEENDPITDVCLTHLLELKHLQTLELTGSEMTDEMLDSLKGLPLEALTIRCQDLFSLEPLADFPNLKELTLVNRAITQSDLIQLSNLPSLQQLTFKNCVIDNLNTDISQLNSTKSIECLNFINTSLTANQLLKIKSSLEKHELVTGRSL